VLLLELRTPLLLVPEGREQAGMTHQLLAHQSLKILLVLEQIH
jgi:hypothetical protein